MIRYPDTYELFNFKLRNLQSSPSKSKLLVVIQKHELLILEPSHFIQRHEWSNYQMSCLKTYGTSRNVRQDFVDISHRFESGIFNILVDEPVRSLCSDSVSTNVVTWVETCVKKMFTCVYQVLSNIPCVQS